MKNVDNRGNIYGFFWKVIEHLRFLKHLKYLLLKLGCPAIEFTNGVVSINNLLCGGCTLCQQVCRFNAIS